MAKQDSNDFPKLNALQAVSITYKAKWNSVNEKYE